MEAHRVGNSSLNDDAYIAVFGKEHPGHVRGMGFGVVPSKYFGKPSNTPASTSGGNDVTRQELDASNARIRELEEQVATLTQQFALYSRGGQVISIQNIMIYSHVMMDGRVTDDNIFCNNHFSMGLNFRFQTWTLLQEDDLLFQLVKKHWIMF